MMGNRVRVRRVQRDEQPAWSVELFGRGGGWQTISWCRTWVGALGVANRAAVGRWP